MALNFSLCKKCSLWQSGRYVPHSVVAKRRKAKLRLYPFILSGPYHISYHIISYHITSYHIISYHIISYHIIYLIIIILYNFSYIILLYYFLIHSFMHAFIHSFVCSFARSFIHLFIYLFIVGVLIHLSLWDNQNPSGTLKEGNISIFQLIFQNFK